MNGPGRNKYWENSFVLIKYRIFNNLYEIIIVTVLLFEEDSSSRDEINIIKKFKN